MESLLSTGLPRLVSSRNLVFFSSWIFKEIRSYCSLLFHVANANDSSYVKYIRPISAAFPVFSVAFTRAANTVNSCTSCPILCSRPNSRNCLLFLYRKCRDVALHAPLKPWPFITDSSHLLAVMLSKAMAGSCEEV